MDVLVVGCGGQGSSHARSAARLPGVRLAGLVDPNRENRERLAAGVGDPPGFTDFAEALAATRPDAVLIATWPETHATYAIGALEAGAHVFVEKPLAPTVAEAEAVVAAAHRAQRQLYVGYILRSSPAWSRFIEAARTLGKPLVMRMNLNQQSSGAAWEVHKHLLASMSPIVDCGVHYVDVMCQMTGADPVRVQAIGARLSDEIDEAGTNYGMLQVVFADGSVGWYEAGWGPMMSETAWFVKDVVGPEGCVSIASEGRAGASDDIESHTATECLRIHSAERDGDGRFTTPDRLVDTSAEPDHQGLCDRQQAYFFRAIAEGLDLSEHHRAAVNSLRVVLAADRSVKEGCTVEL